jgi:hypothetical protein
VTIDGVWILNGFTDHLCTPLELHFRDNWHTQTSDLSLLQSPRRFLATDFYRERFLSFRRLGPLVTATLLQKSCQMTTQLRNWIPGWRPFHANLHVFSPHADFQLTTDDRTLSLTNQLLHVTSLH